MKVLLVAPELKFNVDTPPMPLGLMAVGTYLKKCGHNVRIFDRSIHSDKLSKIYNEFVPDIVGVTIISTRMVKDAITVSKFFSSKNVPIVWGGIFPSELPDVLLKESYIDYISIGEGEKMWEEFLFALENNCDLHSVNGLAFKENDKIIVNASREFMKPEEIPAIDYSLININDYTNDYGEDIGRNMVWLYSAKGCPHQCTFCYNKAFNKCKYRRRSVESYMEEIRYLINNTEVDSIFFADEIWCNSKKDMYERCRQMKEYDLDFTWACFMNVGILDYDDYKFLYDCGCRIVYFGIESGSQSMLDRVKKSINAESAVDEIKKCSEAGIIPYVSFIIGLPDETKDELKKTADMLKEISYYGKLFCFFYIPYVGSELFNDLVKNGKMEEIKSINDINTKFPFNSIVKGAKRNLTKVPMRDLNLVYSYSLLWSFYNKAELKNCKNLIDATYKGIRIFLNHSENIEYKGKSLLMFLFNFAYTYIAALLRVLFFRTTAKKYGLKIR